MSLMVVNGSELIRYNPSTSSIEASNSRGFSWSMRYRCSDMGNIRALTLHKGEIILCSDKGIYVSKNSGKAWVKRNSSERNFVDIQDMGSELVAITSDGHVCNLYMKGRRAPIVLSEFNHRVKGVSLELPHLLYG